MNRTMDMTRGNPPKQILTFALPLILTNVGQQIYMIVDAAIVGQGIGMKALAAVGATDWSYWVILWTITTMTQGFSTFVSRYYGEKNDEKLHKAIAMSLILSGAVAVILTVAGLALTKPVLALLKTPEDIFRDACVYLSTMIAGSLAVAAYNMTASILRAFGDGKSPMVAMGIAAVLNVGLDLLLAVAWGLGVFGAALASVLSQGIAFLYCLYRIRKMEFLHITRRTFRLDFAMMRELLAFGLPLALQYIIINLSGVILQSTVNLQGSTFVAGYTANNKVYGLMECFAISLSFSATTFFSQNYGAKKPDRIRKGMQAAVGIGIGMALVTGGALVCFGRQLLGLFLNAAEAEAAQAMAISYRYLVTMSATLVILYLIYVYRSILQSVGSSIPSMVSGFTECGARVLVAKGLFTWFGQEMLFFAEPIAWLGSLVYIMGAYYLLRNRYFRML